MADEVESHQTKQLAICFRFVDKECNIREEFLEFGEYEQIKRASVFKEIMRIVEKNPKNNRNVEFYRGQGYEEAANIYSQAVGVQKRVYTHCCGHNRSLVLVSTCKIPVVHNVLDIVKEESRSFVK